MGEPAPAPTIVHFRIRFIGDLPGIVGRRTDEVEMIDGCTFRNVLEVLCTRYGENFRQRMYCGLTRLQHTVVIFVNGDQLDEIGGIDARLHGNDVEILMLPMFGGG